MWTTFNATVVGQCAFKGIISAIFSNTLISQSQWKPGYNGAILQEDATLEHC